MERVHGKITGLIGALALLTGCGEETPQPQETTGDPEPQEATEQIEYIAPDSVGLPPEATPEPLGRPPVQVVPDEEFFEHYWARIVGPDERMPLGIDFDEEILLFLAVDPEGGEEVYIAKGEEEYHVTYAMPEQGAGEVHLYRLSDPSLKVRVSPYLP